MHRTEYNPILKDPVTESKMGIGNVKFDKII